MQVPLRQQNRQAFLFGRHRAQVILECCRFKQRWGGVAPETRVEGPWCSRTFRRYRLRLGYRFDNLEYLHHMAERRVRTVAAAGSC